MIYNVTIRKEINDMEAKTECLILVDNSNVFIDGGEVFRKEERYG